MSAMKEYLMDQIDRLAQETGYSEEFLMDTWLVNPDGMTWEQFLAAAQERRWLEISLPGDALWMITVSPDCDKPVVRCAELEKPYPFAVTIMARDFTRLPGLIAEAIRRLDGLRRGVA